MPDNNISFDPLENNLQNNENQIRASENISNPDKTKQALLNTKITKLFSFINSSIIESIKKPENRKIVIAVILVLITGIFAVVTSCLKSKSLIQNKNESLLTSKIDGFNKLNVPERDQTFFKLKTKEVRKFGILPREEFILESIKPITASYVESIISDSEKYLIEQKSEKEIVIRNKNPLDFDQPILITLNSDGKELEGYNFDRNYNWAFQAQGKFRVVSTIPGNEKTNVPINTGIEITFSQDGFKDPVDYIQIDPQIEFATKIVDETFVIVPKEELDYETVYTVRLKKGLNLFSRNDPIAEDFEFSFQTQEKVIPGKPKPWILINDNFIQTSPTEPFITKVNAANWNSDMKVNVKVYRFRNSGEFIESRKKYDEAISNWREYYPERNSFSEGLSEVLNEDVSVQEQEEIHYLQLTKNLEPGYYLVEFSVEGELVSNQVWYQSSEIVGYLSLAREDIVVWVNDLAVGQPSNSATVRSYSTGGTWKTNPDGIAKFPSSNEYFNKDNDYFEINDVSGRSVVIPVRSQKGMIGHDEKSRSDYWSYLYTEKYYYHSNDTINVWGMIKNRDTNDFPSASLSLSFSGNIVYSQNLSFTENGSFIAKIPLEEAPGGWYSLELKVGEIVVDSVYFSVREYEKPDMKIEMTANKKAIFTEEEAEFDIRANFFDETPGSNIELNIYENSTTNKSTLITDDSGNAKYVYKPLYKENLYYPRYEGVNALPGLTQDSIVQGNGNVQVFGPRIMMTTKKDQSMEKASYTATINTIDLTNINNGESNDPKGDLVKGKEVKVKIVEEWTEKIETGTSYNFIEKTTYKTYRYNNKSENKKDAILVTNENGEISDSFDMTEGRFYTVTLTAADEGGRKIERKLYFYSSQWYVSAYNLEGKEDTDIYLDLADGRDTNEYSLGEDVNIKLTQQGADYKEGERDRFLFTRSQRGKQDIFIENYPQFNFTFEKDYVPNTYVSAVVFNGRFYKRANGVCRRNWNCGGQSYDYYYDNYNSQNNFKGILVEHKTEDSKLDIKITTSKSKYEPGENVTLEAVVTKDEAPVANASVNLVVVDAALAAINGVRQPTVLASINEDIPHQVYYVYTSHEPIIPDQNAAEKGGGGGGDRDLFKDTAAFFQIHSDESGKAVFEFDLPDNITTWLIYVQAVAYNLDAGQAESSLIASKDFFVTSKFPKNLLLDDTSYISANSFGTALSSNNLVDYTVLFNGNDREIKRLEEKEKAFIEKDFRIPDLTEGTYDVIVRGKYEDKEDGIRLPLEMLKSRIKQDYSTKHSLSEGESVQNLISDDYYKDEPIRLVISDQGKGKFFYRLIDYCYSWGNRLEKKIVSKRSDTLLSDKFGYDKCYVSEPKLSEFQVSDGGLSQVKWGGSYLESSLWAVVVAPDEFDKEAMVEYFESQYNKTNAGSIQKIQSAWATSLLGKSKLRYLQSMISIANSFEEKVYLGLALAQLGDTETARELYLDILADYAYELSPYVRIDSKQDKGSSLEDFVIETSKTLLLGELVYDKYNDKMYEYVNDYRGSLVNYLIDLSEIEYIETAISNLPDGDTAYTLTTSEGQTNGILDKGRSMQYELDERDIENFEFDLIEGKADLFAKYFVGINVLNSKKQDDRISIKRTVTKAKSDDKRIKPGDIVKISFELKMDLDSAPKGSYIINDYLPSGLTYINNPGSFGLTDGNYARQSDDNKITLSTYNSKFIFTNGKATMAYYAKASAVGRFKAEPAVFQSLEELSVFTMTVQDVVVIE